MGICKGMFVPEHPEPEVIMWAANPRKAQGSVGLGTRTAHWFIKSDGFEATGRILV
jgi:hypothetical protein